MRAAILAGGLGTRLAPYTTILPKPLVPVGEQPILQLILRQLAACGITRVDLCVGHLAGLIQTYFATPGVLPDGLELDYHLEEQPLGTAGAVRNLDVLDGPILVMNGDVLTTLDYGELIRFHEESESVLTIASHRKQVRIDLGVIEGEGEIVEDYVEKPTLGYEVSMGIYVYSQRAIAHIPEGRFDFPDLVLALIAAGEPVRRYSFDGPWFDIGTAGELELANAAYAADPGQFVAGLPGENGSPTANTP